MVDEKDRLGEQLRQKEKAEEDRYFSERDRVLLERMRHERKADQERTIAELTRMRCPKCGARLVPLDQHGVTVDECPACRGIWLDQGELERLAQRERDSCLGRFFYRPTR